MIQDPESAFENYVWSQGSRALGDGNDATENAEQLASLPSVGRSV